MFFKGFFHFFEYFLYYPLILLQLILFPIHSFFNFLSLLQWQNHRCYFWYYTYQFQILLSRLQSLFIELIIHYILPPLSY